MPELPVAFNWSGLKCDGGAHGFCVERVIGCDAIGWNVGELSGDEIVERVLDAAEVEHGGRCVLLDELEGLGKGFKKRSVMGREGRNVVFFKVSMQKGRKLGGGWSGCRLNRKISRPLIMLLFGHEKARREMLRTDRLEKWTNGEKGMFIIGKGCDDEDSGFTG